MKVKTVKPRQVEDGSSAIPRRRNVSHRAPDRPLRSGARLSHATLRRWHAMLKAAAKQPRAASSLANVEDIAADIADLLGPCVDPDHVPDARVQARGFVVTMPDGSEKEFRLAAQAAEAYGVKRESLIVMLSRNGGMCQRVEVTPSGGVVVRKVRRAYA
jgi:hypothetical protein